MKANRREENMKKISRISGALLISMLLSSILSGVVLVIMGTLNLPLDMQSIKVICGSIASVGYFYFFRIFGSITKLMGFRIPHIINSAHINEF